MQVLISEHTNAQAGLLRTRNTMNNLWCKACNSFDDMRHGMSRSQWFVALKEEGGSVVR